MLSRIDCLRLQLSGFASGRLRTWRDAYCKGPPATHTHLELTRSLVIAELAGLELGGSGAMYKVGDAVWIDTPMIVAQRACFLR